MNKAGTRRAEFRSGLEDILREEKLAYRKKHNLPLQAAASSASFDSSLIDPLLDKTNA